MKLLLALCAWLNSHIADGQKEGARPPTQNVWGWEQCKRQTHRKTFLQHTQSHIRGCFCGHRTVAISWIYATEVQGELLDLHLSDSNP